MLDLVRTWPCRELLALQGFVVLKLSAERKFVMFDVDTFYEWMWQQALLAVIPVEELEGNEVVFVSTVEEANGDA